MKLFIPLFLSCILLFSCEQNDYYNDDFYLDSIKVKLTIENQDSIFLNDTVCLNIYTQNATRYFLKSSDKFNLRFFESGNANHWKLYALSKDTFHIYIFADNAEYRKRNIQCVDSIRVIVW